MPGQTDDGDFVPGFHETLEAGTDLWTRPIQNENEFRAQSKLRNRAVVLGKERRHVGMSRPDRNDYRELLGRISWNHSHSPHAPADGSMLLRCVSRENSLSRTSPKL